MTGNKTHKKLDTWEQITAIELKLISLYREKPKTSNSDTLKILIYQM